MSDITDSSFGDRFTNIVQKIDLLSVDKTLKDNAKKIILSLINDISVYNLVWVEPVIHCDYSNDYMCVGWTQDIRNLYLNIDYEELWWSKHWEEDNKVKTDFLDVDYNNLLIHWKWLINDIHN